VQIGPDIGDEEGPERLRAVDLLLFESTRSNSIQDIIDLLLLLEEVGHLASVEEVVDGLQELFIKYLSVYE
jgi:hypothetical protein